MGLYDREYYREEHARREAWQVGPVTMGLIVATILIFFIQIATTNLQLHGVWSDPLLKWGGFSPEKILEGEVWRLVTPLFLHSLHGNFWILAGGIIVLAYCGRGVEGTYGPKEMFWYYVVTGLVTQLALLAVCVAKPFNFTLQGPGYGSGGPVAAVMVLYALLAPNDRVPLYFGSVRARVLATIIILVNLGLFAASNGRYFPAIPVLVGAAFALAYHQFHWRVSNWIPDLPGLRRTSSRPSPVKSRPLFQSDDQETPHPSPPPTPAWPMPGLPEPAVPTAEEHLEAELDRVLGKVAKSGKTSLTPDEHAILLRASEIYKTRRK